MENHKANFTFSALNNYKATDTLIKIQNFQKAIKIEQPKTRSLSELIRQS